MKKIAITLMMLLLVNGVSDGAVSDDVYVRKDVYEANMQGMNAKLDMILDLIKEQREEHKAQMKELKDEMNGIREDVKAHVKESQEEHKAIRSDIAELTRVVSVLSTRVDGLGARIGDTRSNLEGRMSDLQRAVDGRIGDLRNDIYLGLVILGIVVGLPAVQKALQKWEERKAARNASQLPFTLDDVRRLIEENNARMAGRAQA